MAIGFTIALSRISIFFLFSVFGFVYFKAYLEQNGNYSLINTIFWYLLIMISLNSIVPLIYLAICAIYIISIYLRYRFRQLYESINDHQHNGNQHDFYILKYFYKKNFLKYAYKKLIKLGYSKDLAKNFS